MTTFTTQTQESGSPPAIDSLRTAAELHVLIGGPYIAGGEEHRYGHTALRVKTGAIDRVYDFGRYGRVGGDFGAEGEGILRIWSSFSIYIAGESALKRKTTGFVYAALESQAGAVNQYMAKLIRLGKPRPDLQRGRPHLEVHQLRANYHGLGYNCTTLTLDGMAAAFPTFERGSAEFIKPGDVLSFIELGAMKTVGGGTPSRIFLPANLEGFLSSKPSIKALRIERYGTTK